MIGYTWQYGFAVFMYDKISSPDFYGSTGVTTSSTGTFLIHALFRHRGALLVRHVMLPVLCSVHIFSKLFTLSLQVLGIWDVQNLSESARSEMENTGCIRA